MSETTKAIEYEGVRLPELNEDPSSWRNSSLLSVTQITGPGLRLLLDKAGTMRDLVKNATTIDVLRGKIVSTAFFEASTRTACSFQAAAMRLGGNFLHMDGKGNTSAGQKGETLEDTIACLECYADLTVLRHPIQGSVGKVIGVARKPVLNAGDGVGEHPTQALLDVYTIYDELQLKNNDSRETLKVVMLGDLKHGRTVHSLAKLLSSTTFGILWKKELIIRLCSPPELAMPDHIIDFCQSFPNVNVDVVSDLVAASQNANVLYVTRVQRERFANDEAYERVKVREALII
jgi:carbamoyl-phosphate synthase/aspartate carbamoyltransferase/dihydroorotase